MTKFDSNKTSNASNFVSLASNPLIFCFSLSTFLSALLLFLVQPMFTKMALPYLGGASGVWNTAMVFFQAMLLAGYLYAHLLSHYLALKFQIWVHVAVLAASLIFLPISIPEAWTAPEAANTPVLWIIGLFAVALGVPFFALSANAPLLQRWFSYSNHPSAQDPYFLYAASNLGSLFSLLSFPILVEPNIGIAAQTKYWAFGFGGLLVIILLSGILVNKFKSAPVSGHRNLQNEQTSEIPNLKKRGLWILCAAIPSGLMLGVTTHITSNVASVPLLWVLPLAIYLLTFVIVFAARPVVKWTGISRLYVPIALALLLSIKFPVIGWLPGLILHLTGFFILALICHARLAETRPSVDYLTQFYLLMSLGGVLGGASVALFAPVIFNDVFEYPLLIVTAAFLVAGTGHTKYKLKEVVIKYGLSLIAVTAALFIISKLSPPLSIGLILGLLVAIFGSVYLSRKTPVSLFLALGLFWIVLLNAFSVTGDNDKHLVFKERSFFGIVKVIRQESDYGPAHMFIHGNTVHNFQLRDQSLLNLPMAYYAPQGSFGQAVNAVRSISDNMTVAGIGLGAGALACHAKPGEDWWFYEIDPLVVEMAKTPELFSFMEICGPEMPVIIGDARLTLEQADEGTFDLIIVDAFSSDSIPTHLVTREAMALYQSRLKPNGFVFFHTSNRYLNVSAVVGNLANSFNLSAKKISYEATADTPYQDVILPSIGIIVGPKDRLDRLAESHSDWVTVEHNPVVGVWTDDYSHIVGAIRANKD